MSEIRFGGLPKEIGEKLFKETKNPKHFNIHIFKKVYEYKGFELAYNNLMFKWTIEDEGKKDEVKKVIASMFSEFLDKNPELFFKSYEENKDKSKTHFSIFIEANKAKIEKEYNEYFSKEKKTTEFEKELKFLQGFLRVTSYDTFDKMNRGIPLTQSRKEMLRNSLVKVIGSVGAKIEKTAKGSTTTFFIMDNPMTRKGKKYTIQYHSMPSYLKNKYHDTDSYVTFEIKDYVLKEGEGKEFKSKLYEEIMTTEDKNGNVENLDEVLNLQQRRARAMTMKRFASKIAMAKKRSSKRMADSTHLERRARKAAINILRKRLAGALGQNYANLSPGQKMEIDKKVEAKKNLIQRMAQRLLPKIKSKEINRLRTANKTAK